MLLLLFFFDLLSVFASLILILLLDACTLKIVYFFGVLTSLSTPCKKAKWLSGEALQIAVKRREVKSKGEKERYKHLNAEFQRTARRDKKAFLKGSMQRNRGKQQNGKD